MPIKRSAGSDVKSLIEVLLAGGDVLRESAIARLAILGSGAMDRLLAAYRGAGDRDAKIALLRAMEAIGDRRAAPVAARAVAEGGDVAIAAAGVLRSLVNSSHTPTATAALDALVAVALDTGAGRRLRLAAFDALQDVPGDVRARVAAALGTDVETAPIVAADAVWADAVAGTLPDEPAPLRDALQARSATAPLTVLQKLIDAIRAREGTVRAAPRRAEWRALRGALHQTLARRGSRVALYDLRETLGEATEPLPVAYLAAIHVLGDTASLEALAAAYSRSKSGDEWWRHQLAAAFHAVLKRERITRRHAVMKRIQSRWPAAAADLAAQ